MDQVQGTPQYQLCERIMNIYASMGTILTNKRDRVSNSNIVYGMVNSRQCSIEQPHPNSIWYKGESEFNIALIHNRGSADLSSPDTFLPKKHGNQEYIFQHPSNEGMSFDVYNSNSSNHCTILHGIEETLDVFDQDRTNRDLLLFAAMVSQGGKPRPWAHGFNIRINRHGEEYQILSRFFPKPMEVTIKGRGFKLTVKGDNYFIKGMNGTSPEKIVAMLDELIKEEIEE